MVRIYTVAVKNLLVGFVEIIDKSLTVTNAEAESINGQDKYKSAFSYNLGLTDTCDSFAVLVPILTEYLLFGLGVAFRSKVYLISIIVGVFKVMSCSSSNSDVSPLTLALT